MSSDFQTSKGALTSPKAKIAQILHLVLWSLLVFLVFRETIAPALRPPILGFYPPGGIVDFASHLNFARHVWMRQTTVTTTGGASVYSVQNHLKVTSSWASVPLPRALPFGYSPTMLWILGPFALLSAKCAFVLWNVLGLGIMYWATRPGNSPFGLGLIGFFSPLSFSCFFIGQTAILSMAGLLFLSCAGASGSKHSPRGTLQPLDIISAFVLWALTAKPPLAVASAVVLFGMRRWKVLLLAILLTVLSTAAIQPWLGHGWVSDYLGIVTRYNNVEADPAFAWSFVPAHMANLRALLHLNLGVPDNFANRLSVILWLAGCAFVAWLPRRTSVSAHTCWSLSILTYLILFPHVTSTEELQLYVTLVLAFRFQRELTSSVWAVLILTSIVPYLSPAMGPVSGDRVWMLIAKVGLIPLTIHALAARPRRKKQSRDVLRRLLTRAALTSKSEPRP